MAAIAAGVALVVVLARWLATGPGPGEEPVASAPPAAAPAQAPPPSVAEEIPLLSPESQPPSGTALSEPLQSPADQAPMGLAAVDLEAVRAALPDNLYWQQAAPTQDPRVLEDREREKARKNDAYGKILSGTGTEEEIRAYFNERMHLSSDYVRFVDHVLDHYGDTLTEQDLELLHVARRLHLARLNEAPRRMQEAFDRKRKQDVAREAWAAEQREFEAGENPEGEPAPEDTDTAAP